MSAAILLIITNLIWGGLLVTQEILQRKRENQLIDRLLAQANLLPLDYNEPSSDLSQVEAPPPTRLIFPLPR